MSDKKSFDQIIADVRDAYTKIPTMEREVWIHEGASSYTITLSEFLSKKIRYSTWTWPCGCCTVVGERIYSDVRSRILGIASYIENYTKSGDIISIPEYVKLFDDHAGYTRSDVCSAVLILKERGILKDSEDYKNIVRV